MGSEMCIRDSCSLFALTSCSTSRGGHYFIGTLLSQWQIIQALFFPRATSEGFLLCRSPTGAELSFPGRCRRVAAGLPAGCRQVAARLPAGCRRIAVV